MQADETPRLVFPDTTVLVNFALVDEMSLLALLVGENGCWCGTVASECDDQASKQGLPRMREAHQVFGEPLRMQTQREFIDFRLNQDFFRQASSNPEATHAGESETLAIISARSIKSLVVSDDGAVALRLANLELDPTVQATTSWHFFRVAYWKGHISEARFWEIRRVLLEHQRGCPDDVRDPAKFTVWITRPS